MAGLLDKPTTTTDAPETATPPGETAPEAGAPAPAPEAPARTCETCAAPLAEGQDWCLECGSAQPGRLGGRPGWRAALTVLAVTLLLVGGAAAAAYAALTTEAQRDATAAAPPQATPTVAAPPPAPAPAPTTPEQETPTVEAPQSDPADVPAPTDSGDEVDTPAPTPAPSTPSSPSTPSAPSTSGGSSTGGGTDTTTEDEAAAPVAIDLPAKAATLYDPFGRAASAGAKPANAVDGKDGTAFELPVAPDGTVRAGLALSLDKATTLSDLELKADTPGFTVEVYATKDAQLPPDVLDARWEHVGDRRDSGVEETVELDGKFRHVLLWVTEQPADTKVAIPEVQLFD